MILPLCSKVSNNNTHRELRNLTKIKHFAISGFLEKSTPLVVIIVGFYSKQSTTCVFILGKKHYGDERMFSSNSCLKFEFMSSWPAS